MSDLRTSLAAFDEAALVTLANVGLYRRAARDVAEGKVALIEIASGRATVEADGQRVAIDARGPKAADCACRAPGICRHRIAAVLFLQSHDPVEDAPAPPIDPAAMLAEFDPARVERWAGKAAWRAALEIAETPAAITAEDNAITVAFADPHPIVRILRGQGADGIVSKAPPARQKTLHAAAIIAARRHFGLAEPASEPEALAETATDTLPDPAFLAQVAAALSDCAVFAFNLAPEPVEEQLFVLSVSSRADALPRLGRILRTLAAQMRLKRQRAFTFDPDLCLETLAIAFALVRALSATADPARLRMLQGVYRQTYVPGEALHLVGCGADRWRTEAGARGVTGIFYDPANDRWLTYAHARAAGQDPMFDPVHAYTASAIWGGVTLQRLGGAMLTLHGAGVSEGNRLSNPAGASARIDAVAADRDAWPVRFADWDALSLRLTDRFGIGLSRRIDADFAILAPRRFAQPYFDDLAQDLIWPVADVSGQWVALSVAHGDGVADMIDRIETLAKRGWQGEILVRATLASDRRVLTPIAIFHGNSPLSLALDRFQPEARDANAWSGLWLRFGTALQGRQDFAVIPPDLTTAELNGLWQRLIDLAEFGLDRARPEAIEGLRRASRTLDDLGYPMLAERVAGLSDQPRESFLAAAYALHVARSQRVRLPLLQPVRAA